MYQPTCLTRVILQTSIDNARKYNHLCPLYSFTKESLIHFRVGTHSFKYSISLTNLLISSFHKHTSHKGHSNNGLGEDIGTLANIFKAYCAMST